MMLNWSWEDSNPNLPLDSDPEKTDNGANLSETPGVQNPAQVEPSDVAPARSGAGTTWLGKSPAEGPRVAVPAGCHPAEGTPCVQGVGAAAWPAE